MANELHHRLDQMDTTFISIINVKNGDALHNNGIYMYLYSIYLLAGCRGDYVISAYIKITTQFMSHSDVLHLANRYIDTYMIDCIAQHIESPTRAISPCENN